MIYKILYGLVIKKKRRKEDLHFYLIRLQKMLSLEKRKNKILI